MNSEKTKMLTTGAMFVAIFAVIMIINRQTGSLFEELIFYILPIPMVGFSAKYGWKPSIPVLVAMTLMSVFFGTITTIFYAATEASIGLVLGVCIYKKRDMTKTLFLVMLLSTIANLVNTVFLASLFGYDINADILEMQNIVSNVVKTSVGSGASEEQIDLITNMFSFDMLKRIYVMSMIILGMIQGFLVYELSLIILRRLRFTIPAPRSVYSFYPPKWTAFLAGALFLGYSFTIQMNMNETLAIVLQTLGMCGYLYLVFFGMLFAVLLTQKYLSKSKILAVVIGFLSMLVFARITVILGFVYVVTEYHAKLVAADGVQKQ